MNLTREHLQEVLTSRDPSRIDPGLFKQIVGMAIQFIEHVERQRMLWVLEKEIRKEPGVYQEAVKYEPGE